MPSGRTSKSGYGSPSFAPEGDSPIFPADRLSMVPVPEKLGQSPALQKHLLAGGADGRGQRIARPQRLVEVGLIEGDVLRLQDHRVAAALDVDRPAAGAVGTVVGNDGVRLGTVGGRLLREGQTLLGIGDLALELPQLLFARRDKTAPLQALGGGLLGLLSQLLKLPAKPAAVVFDMAKHQASLRPIGPRSPSATP